MLRLGWMCVGCVVCAIGLIGCQEQQDERPTSMRGKAPSIDVMEPEIVDITATQSADEVEAVPVPEAGSAPSVPTVTLPQSDLDSSPVKVGDAIPSAELPMPGDAASHAMSEFYGTKATVVLVWNPANLYSVQGLEMLNGELPKAFAAELDAKHLAVIGVAASTTSDVVGDTVAEGKILYPVLVDADGQWCAKVANEPYRLFLLDANGKIAWFDLECGDASLRDLKVGIQALLAM